MEGMRANADRRGVRPGFATGRKTPSECNMRSGAVTHMRRKIARRVEFVDELEAEAAWSNPRN